MFKWGRHFSPAMLVALLAVFLSLTGTGYAVSQLARNSVTTVHVKDRSLLARDFKHGQLPRGARGPRGFDGVPGAPGPAGPAGAKGDKGDPGPGVDVFERWMCTTGFGVGCTSSPSVITATSSTGASYFLTMDVPAGSYVVTAEMIVSAPAASDWDVRCQARTTSPGFGGESKVTVADSTDTVTVVFGAPNQPATQIGLKCWTDGGTGSAPSVLYAEVVALKVGNITQSVQP